MNFLFHNCAFCNYKTKRKYDLKRHQNAVHNLINKENKNCKNLNDDCKNLSLDYKNLNDDCKNLNDDCRNLNDDCKNLNDDNKCNKCNKILSSKYYLQKHLLICKGVSNPLECHICHKIYSCYASKSNHLKICKEKSQQLIIPDEIIVDKQSFELIKPKEQIIQQLQTINNNTQIINNTNCNNNNITYNINLIRFDEEELKIDFDINHLEINTIVHKLYIIQPEDAFRVFYKKLFENKNNQMTIKENLKHTYSNVHTGRNIWRKMLDDYIYHIIMHFIAETLLSYIYKYTKNKQDHKYKQLRDYADYMATKGYSSNNTKEIEKSYKNHIKSLKYLFNSFKDDE
jgi:hypothetical protein